MKFQIIVADPPWGAFKDSLKMNDIKRGASDNYNTLTTKQISNLLIKDITDPNGALLALWIPSSLLQDGLDVMKLWGFNHKQTYVWVKIKKNILLSSKPNQLLSFGMGRLMRQTHELCLIGINNKNIYKLLKNKSQRSVCFAQNTKHSTKPEDLQDSLDEMFPDCSKIELFSRRQRPNWICIGNESPTTVGEDINVSVNSLKDEV